MELPKDPVILMSYLNTQLRDTYPSLVEFCQANGCDAASIESKLAAISYVYDADKNQFVHHA